MYSRECGKDRIFFCIYKFATAAEQRQQVRSESIISMQYTSTIKVRQSNIYFFKKFI